MRDEPFCVQEGLKGFIIPSLREASSLYTEALHLSDVDYVEAVSKAYLYERIDSVVPTCEAGGPAG